MDMVDFNLHHDVRCTPSMLSCAVDGCTVPRLTVCRAADKHPACVLAATLKDLARQMYYLVRSSITISVATIANGPLSRQSFML
jgi:hypothetical protein